MAKYAPKWARRVDSTQSPIVDGIRDAGYTVLILGRPLDLLVMHPNWYRNVFVLLEAKTRNRKDGYAPRSDQETQQKFCETHEVPYVTTVEEALVYLELRGRKLIDPYSEASR